MAQKFVVSREIVKAKVAQREKITELENTISVISQKVETIEKAKETTK